MSEIAQASTISWSVQIYKMGLVLDKDFVSEEVGTIDHQPEIKEHLKIGDRTYVVCYISFSRNLCGVHEIKEYNGYHEGTGNMVCPYCGYEDVDAFELSADDGEHECGRCGRPFEYERHYEISYSTKKIGGDAA